ncbi:MAG: DUF4436 domain-containing protein [Actinomycetota bacterium]|uniref:DUF4436 domain-containing protein n=1 Tax=Mycobacterium lentiflavum TaxID=141349 RepID=A0ABY3UUP5_MYCLN|nr:DUF4436 domain-containing protein [Mycobacterium lentiflavum]MEE3067589.1 DUF4436 domain-containing protein [Actinomycetota bacterium]ULP43316.1 DUF4436 domain-containing protein [Mycobacterium lentiflavum]
MTAQAPPTHAAPPPPPKPKRRRLLGIAILGGFVVVYALSLFGFVLLGESAAPLKTPDLNAADDTVVLLRVEELKTVANRLGVKVLVYPQEAMWDSRLDVLKQDTAVRMDPPNDLGDLVYPAGKSPAQVATTVEAHGDPEIWPFDSYETDTLSADVLVGSGDDRKYKPARIEVAGKLEGWDVSVQRVGEGGDSVIITLQRSKAPLIFDLGICLVLFAMPTIALAVVIPMVIGKRKVVPPFGGWFAALLFAVIPIRNFLPGAPPPGAWIDQALVIWVLIALVGAMGLYMLAWYRRSD